MGKPLYRQRFYRPVPVAKLTKGRYGWRLDDHAMASQDQCSGAALKISTQHITQGVSALSSSGQQTAKPTAMDRNVHQDQVRFLSNSCLNTLFAIRS